MKKLNMTIELSPIIEKYFTKCSNEAWYRPDVQLSFTGTHWLVQSCGLWRRVDAEIYTPYEAVEQLHFELLDCVGDDESSCRRLECGTTIGELLGQISADIRSLREDASEFGLYVDHADDGSITLYRPPVIVTVLPDVRFVAHAFGRCTWAHDTIKDAVHDLTSRLREQLSLYQSKEIAPIVIEPWMEESHGS